MDLAGHDRMDGLEPHRHLRRHLRPRSAGSVGVTPVTCLQLCDGWFFSLGAEYQWTERLMVRGGAAYEISPVTDDVRIPAAAGQRPLLAFGWRNLDNREGCRSILPIRTPS